MKKKYVLLALVSLTSAILAASKLEAFTRTGTRLEARDKFTTTALADGRVLVVGGIHPTIPDSFKTSCEVYELTPRPWSLVGPLRVPRARHSATLLQNGNVLVVGGENSTGPLSSAEIYDPAADEWREVASAWAPHADHTATLLPSGKVLIYGPANVELYDPISDFWLQLKNLPAQAIGHTATLLPNGKVLFLPEASSGLQPEIYDSENDSWQTLPPPGDSAYIDIAVQHSATLLESGEVLITRGGCNPCSVLQALVYKPADQTWRSTENQRFQSLFRPQTVLLPSGKILHVGMVLKPYPAFRPQIYDPATNTWSLPVETSHVENAIPGQYDFTTTLLLTGDVLLTGFDSKSTYLFWPNLAAWNPAGPLSEPRTFLTLTPTRYGTFAIGGKNQDSAVGTHEVFDDTLLTWSERGSLNIPRFKHTATLLPNGKILVAGGQNEILGTALPGELIDPQTGASEVLHNLVIRTDGQHTATLLPNGEVLFIGGTWNDSRTYLFNLETRTLRQAASLSQFRFEGHTATLLPTGKLIVIGGQGFEVTARVELYDPTSNQWTDGPSLNFPRSFHSTNQVSSLGLVVTGGTNGGLPINVTEANDFPSGQWFGVGFLFFPREKHFTVTLPSGELLAIAGLRRGGPTPSTEIFAATTGLWRLGPALGTSRSGHSATLTPGGNLLIAGGDPEGPETETASSEILRVGRSATREPLIHSVSDPLRHTLRVKVIASAGPGAAHEASHGGSQSSPTNLPVFLIQALSDGDLQVLVPQQRTNLPDNLATFIFSELPDNLNPGQHFLYSVVNGILSPPFPVTFECSAFIESHPASQTAALGASVSFTAVARGARAYQWQKNSIDIPGANLPTYTTPPVSAADNGSSYRVRVDGGCQTIYSANAQLDVVDNEAPKVTVTSPSGGEYWPLSRSGQAQSRTVAWQMSDNIRLCRVEVALIYSSDGGLTWNETPPGDNLPKVFGEGIRCSFPGVGTTNLSYTIPSTPPSGSIGSLYKIRVRATDYAGNIKEAASRNPFFIVQPNADSIQTLILHNLPRMRSVQGISVEDRDSLATNLEDLANHPRVLGRLIDLSLVPQLSSAYAAWDADPADIALANELVQMLRAYLKTEIFPIYTGTRSIVVVGDDRIFPMARIGDITALAESAYLLPTDSTVGQSLAQNHYLTDDLLGVRGQIDLPLAASALRRGAFLPELPVGRLVEEPNEIIQTIATYISQDGILDLGARRVLVTGYDFLKDSAHRIFTRWQNAISSNADGELVGDHWTEEQLCNKLKGDYAIYNLNGHATHHEEGIPSATEIAGLAAEQIYGLNPCGGGSPVELSGALIYAVGCHGGLPVPGATTTGPDYSLDLPQTFLARGAMAYLANSGYGWGLRHGVGLSERLVELFTEELLEGGRTVQVGEAFLRAKRRYYLELPGFDIYDQKTLLQWSLFGLPFYAVQLGDTPSLPNTVPKVIETSSQERPARENIDGVVVERSWPLTLTANLPPNLVQLDLEFDFSADGVYRKYDALGQVHPGPGCNEPLGCYYRLNGLATSTPDLPIQPYFVYDSRLSGTSHHGALWLGGRYSEESNFIPVIAELVSNGGDYSDHGATPRLIRPKPYPELAATGDDAECRTIDSELNTLVMVTGESLRSTTSLIYDLHRRFERVDLEAFYFNDDGEGGNCDRTGPTMVPADDSGFHQVDGSRVEWALRASDGGNEAAVWRVVVVYDLGPDSEGQGSWIPLELSKDSEGIWRGSLVTAAPRLTYFVQAVDRRGNVGWIDFLTTDIPASGVSPDLPDPIEVELGGSIDLSLRLSDSPDPVAVGNHVAHTVFVSNLGLLSANQLRLTVQLPPGLAYGLAGGAGWSCEEDQGVLTCQLSTLSAGASTTAVIYTTAVAGGMATTFARVSALETDLESANNEAIEQTFVTSNFDLIFSDGFESGDTTAWSKAEP